MCAPGDFAEQVARVGVPMVPVGQSVRALVHGVKPPSAADAPRVAADLVAAQFDTVAAAAEVTEVGLSLDRKVANLLRVIGVDSGDAFA